MLHRRWSIISPSHIMHLLLLSIMAEEIGVTMTDATGEIMTSAGTVTAMMVIGTANIHADN